MCGIVGCVGDRPVDQLHFDAMVDSLAARGPDGRGTRYLHNDRVALGHRRLAIVDLSDLGSQPMTNETNDVWLTFNGEIYNHASLRRELELAGHRYRSTSDSETILHAYEEWGPDCVRRFRGIFAFAIWDSRSESLFCARDHLGVKPFYFASTDGELIFASQPRAILRAPGFSAEVDEQGFVDFLSYGIVPHDRAAFQGMSKLPPGSTLTWRDGKFCVARYWTVKYDPQIRDFDEAIGEIRSHIESAVEMQLMADVPVATYLSGGIDSSLIAAIAAQKYPNSMQSITIGFHEEASDERPYARLAAEHIGTDHTESVLTRDDALELIDTCIETYDEPYALGAAFPMLAIARLTQSLGIKVVLAGDGADELFSGYLHYDAFEALYRRHYGKATPPNRLMSWWNRIRGKNIDPIPEYFPREGVLHPGDQERLVEPDVFSRAESDKYWRFRKFFHSDLRAVTAAQIMDLHTYLPGEILTKVDRATMAYGVEARVPFLDPKLVELAFTISADVHYRDGARKAALKAASRAYLPQSVLTARKKGFSIPLVEWLLKDNLRDSMIDEMEHGHLVERGLLTHRNLRKKCQSIPGNYVWQLYVAERWVRRWCNG